MSLLSLASGGLREQAILVPSGSWTGSQGNGSFYFGMGGRDTDVFVGGNNGSAWYMNAYRWCPPVASIINRKAEAFVNGQNFVTTKSGKGKGKGSESAAATKIKKLLARPNPLQSWSQFEAKLYIYYQIYGYCLVLPIRPVGYGNPEDTSKLWIIPPSLVNIEEGNDLWYANDGKGMIKKITLTLGNETTTLNWDDLIFIKDFVPSISSLIIPESRMQGLLKPIETVIKGYRAMCHGFDNTPLGIIGNNTKDSMGYIPLDPEEKKRLQLELTQYGLGYRQNKFILSDAALAWSPINYPIDSLKLPEHTKMAVAAICDGLGYKYELLASETGTTFNNVAAARKDLIENFIMPVAKSIYEQWNEYFKTDDLNLVIEKDYSHLPVLQEDKINAGRARWYLNQGLLIEFQNDLITVNRWLELNGEDTRTDGDIYYSQWIKDHPEMLSARYTVSNTPASVSDTTTNNNNS